MCTRVCVRLTARKGSSTRVWYSRNPCLVSFALGRHCQSALVPIKMKNKPAVETFCRPCGLKVEAYLTVGGLCSASCLTGLEAGSGFLTNVTRIVFFLRWCEWLNPRTHLFPARSSECEKAAMTSPFPVTTCRALFIYLLCFWQQESPSVPLMFEKVMQLVMVSEDR